MTIILSLCLVSALLVALSIFYHSKYKTVSAELSKEHEINNNPAIVRLQKKCPECEKLNKIIRMEPGTNKQAATLEFFASRKQKLQS